MAVVGIHAVNTVGGDLIRLLSDHHDQGAVLQTEVMRHMIAENRAHFFGLGVGADVPVVRTKPQQRVAHTAADRKRLKAVRLQLMNDLICFGFDRQFYHITFF